MKKSLSDLQKAIKGTVVMSIQLENMFLAFLDKKVPELWENHAYIFILTQISFLKATWILGERFH